MLPDSPCKDSGLTAGRSMPDSPTSGVLQLSREPTSMTLHASKVHIQIDSESFILDRDRLAAVCPQFATMFSLPTTSEEEIVPLHNKLEHFKAFVWYLNVHPQTFSVWRDAPVSHEKCCLLVGIATIAHMYEAHDVAVWAVDMALKMLEVHNRPFVPEPEMLSDLYTVALKVWMDARTSRDRPNFALHWQRVENVWMDVLSVNTIDVVPYLLAAKNVHSSPLEAVSYFYTLRCGAAAISSDKRLSAEDRRRLLTGSHAFALRGQPLAENSWATPAAPGPLNGQWQPRKDSRMGDIAKLWETFASPPWNIGT